MTSMPAASGLLGFGVALLAYGVLLLLVLGAHPATRSAYCLTLALIFSILWAGINFYGLWVTRAPSVWLPVVDALHLMAWLGFIAAMLYGTGENAVTRRVAVFVVAAGGLLTGISFLSMQTARFGDVGGESQLVFIAILGLALLGLLGLEQIARNAHFSLRTAVKPFVAGIGLIFVLDIVAYSQAFLSRDLNIALWQLRGVGCAAAAPFLLVAVKRQKQWQSDLAISRDVVFHSATLFMAGGYLLLLGFVGTIVGPEEGGWWDVVEWLFFFLAVAVFVYAVLSVSVRRRIKVFIAKHFYKSRYDYRSEWLRLIRTLAGDGAGQPLSERGVRALAEIVDSPGGELWVLQDDKDEYEGYGAWNLPVPSASLPRNGELVRFLQATHWVIDSEEYRRDPALYEYAFSAPGEELQESSIYLPLVLGSSMIGVVRLHRAAGLGPLGYEDHDLLKTAGRQVAIFLAQERAQSELAETRQLEAFSKLTAFLMHDLKNLISQQELVVGNARRFKHRPEFIEDVIRTIEGGVERMKRVLERLKPAAEVLDQQSTLDLFALVGKVASSCDDRRPKATFSADAGAQIWVEADREKLTSALTHAIRNAQDATADDGTISVAISLADGFAIIEVADTGKGMAAEFVRNRLFKPFQSTKGASGMGIGAYQIRETFKAFGGGVDVDSIEGLGTRLRMKMPLARNMHPSVERASV